MKKLFAAIAAALMLTACTEQTVTRAFGGSMEIELPKGEKLVMATWKKASLFYLTEPMPEGYEPTTRTFRESSEFGVMESTVIFIESR